MANIVPLKFTAKLICIQTLLDLSGDGDKEAAQRILRQLQTGCYTAVSCGLLRRLVERYPGKVTNTVLSALASTHLRELKLKKCKFVSFTGLKNVLESCPLVTKLDLSECDQFSQPEVFHITSFLRPGITALSLENCLTVDNAVVQSILSYMKNLQHLNLSGCTKLTDNVFLLNENHQLQRETFGQISQDRYDCSLISVDISCTTLTSTAVRHLATLTGPTLRHVNISWTGADTLALLYLSGYGRPSIVDLTLSDPDTVLDRSLKQSLLELKNTLKQLKLGMLKKERARKGSYGDIPVNNATGNDSLSPIDPNPEFITSLLPCKDHTEFTVSLPSSKGQTEVTAPLPSSKGHPEEMALLSSSKSHQDVTASLSSAKSYSDVETSSLADNNYTEMSDSPKNMSQPQVLQNNDKTFNYTDDLEPVHLLQSSEDGVSVVIGELNPVINLNRERLADDRLNVKSFIEVLEEASDSENSVDYSLEEEDSDSEGSVKSDKVSSAVEQIHVVNGHFKNVKGHSLNDSSIQALVPDVTAHLTGGSGSEGQSCDETINLIDGADIDDLTSDVTVDVTDDSYSWTVDKFSDHDSNIGPSFNVNTCEICSKLKSNIAKCTGELSHKTECSAANKLSHCCQTSSLSGDHQYSQLLQNSQMSERSQISQVCESSHISQNNDNFGNSENCEICENSENKFLQTCDLTCSADSGIPEVMSQNCSLKAKTESQATLSDSCSGLATVMDENVVLEFIEDDTRMKYSFNENVKTILTSKTTPSSAEKYQLPPSKDTSSCNDTAVSNNERIVAMTSAHGDGMTYDEDLLQAVDSHNMTCHGIIISDETGVPMTMSCDNQSGYSQYRAAGSETGITCSESGMICAESGMICAESGMPSPESVVESSECGFTCSESGMTCSESGMTCSESGVTCSESGVTCSESGVTCSESGVTRSESGIKSSEPGVKSSEPGIKSSEPRVKSSEPGIKCSEPRVKSSEPGVKSSEPRVKSSESGAVDSDSSLGDVQHCAQTLNSRTVKCDKIFDPSMVQNSCQTQEMTDRCTSPNDPGAFFDLQKQNEPLENDGIHNTDNSELMETVMKTKELTDHCLDDVSLAGESSGGQNNVDDQNDEKGQSQTTSGYLDESGEYCYSPDPPEQKQTPINCLKNSENGEIENSTEPKVYVQFYKPDLISIDFKRIEFENTYKYSGLKCLKIFSEENKNLQKIKISWKDNLKSSMLEELAPLWPNVSYISLIDCESLTSQSLVTLATKCSKIQTITLQGVTFIQDFAMIPFINNGCLESVNLAECRITDHTLIRMSKQRMDKMKELDLSWCDDTSSVGLDKLFGKSSETLRKLSIRQLAANDTTLSLIASNFCYLTSLNMSSVDGIGDDAVVTLVENIRTLEHVDFSWNLGVSNRSISALLSNCQRLQRADLAGLKTITSEPFLPLISDLKQWRRCQALLRLKLHERSAAAAASADAGSSSDEEYTDIYMPHRSTVYATDLAYLNLEFCDQVSDNHLAEICIVCRRESLTIYNYYGELVKPELFIGQGRQWYSNYIPATDE